MPKLTGCWEVDSSEFGQCLVRRTITDKLICVYGWLCRHLNAMSVFDCSISRTDIEPTQRESKRLTYKLPNGASFQAV